MNTDVPGNQRLSGIDTFWTVLGKAHGETAEAVAAKQQLLQKYTAAVRRYLLGALRDAEAADELSQEFAVRFMKGDLNRADPTRGRFRDFVKGVLFHLIADHHRRRKRTIAGLPDGSLADGNAADPAADDRQFVESWRDELLDRAWVALQKHQEATGQPYHTVLRFRSQQPDRRSAEMADALSTTLGKPVNAAWVRQAVHRARETFADLLVTDVLQTLRDPSVDLLADELSSVGLLEYCRPALDKIRSAG